MVLSAILRTGVNLKSKMTLKDLILESGGLKDDVLDIGLEVQLG